MIIFSQNSLCAYGRELYGVNHGMQIGSKDPTQYSLGSSSWRVIYSARAASNSKKEVTEDGDSEGPGFIFMFLSKYLENLLYYRVGPHLVWYLDWAPHLLYWDDTLAMNITRLSTSYIKFTSKSA